MKTVIRSLLAVIGSALGLALAAPVAVLALPFWITSALTRRIGGWIEPPITPWPEVVRFDAGLGWSLRPDLDVNAEALNGDPFHFRTDSEGWRGERPLSDCEVVVVGDSFAFGHAVDEHAYFGHRVREIGAKAAGVPGYNMVQTLLWLRALGPRLEGKQVVWLIYPGNDLEDSLRPHVLGNRSPFVRERRDDRGGWEIVTHHLDPTKWPFPNRRPNYETYVEICTPSLLSRRVFAACEYLIEQGRDVCDRVGARLTVMTVPDLSDLVRDQVRGVVSEMLEPETFDPELPDRRIAEICARLDVPFVPLADHLTPGDYQTDDVHWNRRGHQRFARLLERLVRTDLGPGGPARARETVAADPIERPAGDGERSEVRSVAGGRGG